MNVEKKKLINKRKRAFRSRSRIAKGTRPRIAVFRSLKYIYGQIIDDNQGKTLASCSSLDLKSLSGDKISRAKSIGIELANRAKEQGVTAVIFDRGSYLYHGRVKAFADGLREGGLAF